MKTGSLHHVELYVPDLEACRHFWCWWLGELGWSPFQEWDEGFSYRQGESYICFVLTTRQNPAYHRKSVGLNHLAFHARDRAHVDQMREQLRERGHTLLYDERFPFAGGPDYYALFCEDPTRMKVELTAS